ncbi:MAG: hypothetical protein K2M12_09970, partial [Muribaculaceae bacterium]|nr:hypothetical protein [Muribaculaceae bacterium]
ASDTVENQAEELAGSDPTQPEKKPRKRRSRGKKPADSAVVIEDATDTPAPTAPIALLPPAEKSEE